MVLSTLITDFLEYLELEKNASQLTIRNYDHCLKRFLEFTKDIEPKYIDFDLIRRYRIFLYRYIDPNNQKPLKKVTQNYFMIALRAFLRYLASQDIVSLLPEKIELSKTSTNPLKVLDKTYLDKVLNAIDISKKDGLRDRSILETLFSTGLRVSELKALDKDQIDLSKKEFSVTGKGLKERVVFLSDAACLWLGRYLEVRKDTFKPLFIRFQGKASLENEGEAMRLTSRSIERIVEKYVKKAGIPTKATPHTLRHTHAVNLVADGVDVKFIQENLGHASILSTQIYTKNK